MDKYILAIDDDPMVGTLLSSAIKNFSIIPAYSLSDALEKLKHYTFSSVFFDIELPDGDGLDFFSDLTKENLLSHIPIFVLSSHTEISKKIKAFSLGADDFISKPFSPFEVALRLQSKIDKLNFLKYNQIEIELGNIVLDLEKQAIFFRPNNKTFDQDLDLGFTHYEFMIFLFLAKNLGTVFSRDEIMNEIWGCTKISVRGIDSHIARIRTKISHSNVKINTSKGSGYFISLENAFLALKAKS